MIGVRVGPPVQCGGRGSSSSTNLGIDELNIPGIEAGGPVHFRVGGVDVVKLHHGTEAWSSDWSQPRPDWKNEACCHGSALGDDKLPATTHATTHATTPATPTTTLPIVAIGRHDISVEAYSIQDLEVLVDTELRGTSEPLACMAQQQNVVS